jgi:hypothetical protein
MKDLTPLTEPDPRRWWALALLCGAFFMVILDAAIVTVALPSIEKELGFSAQELRWRSALPRQATRARRSLRATRPISGKESPEPTIPRVKITAPFVGGTRHGRADR